MININQGLKIFAILFCYCLASESRILVGGVEVVPEPEPPKYVEQAKRFKSRYECSKDTDKSNSTVSLGFNDGSGIIQGQSVVRNKKVVEFSGVYSTSFVLESTKAAEAYYSGNYQYFNESQQFWKEQQQKLYSQSTSSYGTNTYGSGMYGSNVQGGYGFYCEACTQKPGIVVDTRPGIQAGYSPRPGDIAATKRRPGDIAATKLRPGDEAGEVEKPGDAAVGVLRPGDEEYFNAKFSRIDSYKPAPSYEELHANDKKYNTSSDSNPRPGEHIGKDGVYFVKMLFSDDGKLKSVFYRDGYKNPVAIETKDFVKMQNDPMFQKFSGLLEKIRMYSYCCTNGDAAAACDTKFVPPAVLAPESVKPARVLTPAEQAAEKAEHERNMINPFTGKPWGAKEEIRKSTIPSGGAK